MNKRILFFAPFGDWTVHHQVDAILASALRQRGCDVCIVCCDGIFVNCQNSGNPSSPSKCKSCSKSSMKFFSQFQLPVIQLRSLLTESDFKICHEWATNIKKIDFSTAIFKGNEIGKWVYPGVCSYFHASEPDLSKTKHVEIYRSLLFNGALLKQAHEHLINEYMPDHVVCFNATLPYYYIFMKLTKLNKIPVLVHERGPIDDSFSFCINDNPSRLAGRLDALNIWENIPLNTEECIESKNLIFDRELGKGINRNPFFTMTPIKGNIRHILRIPDDSKIIAVFPNSGWELGMSKMLVSRRFETPFDGIIQILENIRFNDIYLIIRLHPNMIGYHYTDKVFLNQLIKFSKERPDNVRIVMPKEMLSSYQIALQSDAAITFGSTMGLESVLRGLFAASNVDSIFSHLNAGIDMILSPSDYERAIQTAISKTHNFSLEDLRTAYRRFHFYFFKLSYKFKSFGIHDNYFSDIRINNLDELKDGNDPTLDLLCDHIINDKPWYKTPEDHDSYRTNEDESNFLAKEYENIIKVRSEAKSLSTSAYHLKEPLLSIIRIRQDGVINRQNSVFFESVAKSRFKNFEIVELPYPYFSDNKLFIEEIIEAVNSVKGDYIYFGTDNTQVDESFFSSAVDFLSDPLNSPFDNVKSGAWICDSQGNFNEGIFDIFTERHDPNNYDDALKILPLINNPAQLLSFFIWRKSSINCFLTTFVNQKLIPDDLSLFLYGIICSENHTVNSHKTLIPQITIYCPEKEINNLSKAIELINNSKYNDALNILETLKRNGCNEKDLDYIRSYSKYQLGNLWEARAIAESKIHYDPSDKKISNLLSNIIQQTESHTFNFKDVEPAIGTIHSELVPGQENYLFDKIRLLPEEALILEIGSYHGRSSASMAFGCVGSKKHIVSIDTFMGMSNAGTKYQGNSFFDIWYLNMKCLGLEKYFTPIAGLSHSSLSKFENKTQFDFVFIDASHHYSDVLKDFELVYPLVKDDGWIAFHDVTPEFPGPWRVWKETASQLLSSHEFCSTISCGRKVLGIDFNINPSQKSFSYSKEWADHLKPFDKLLSDAMIVSMKNDINFTSELESAEQIIASMPAHLIFCLREMLKLEAAEDPFLLFWNALTLASEGSTDKAIKLFLEASRTANFPLKNRIVEHLNLFFPNSNFTFDHLKEPLFSANT